MATWPENEADRQHYRHRHHRCTYSQEHRGTAPGKKKQGRKEDESGGSVAYRVEAERQCRRGGRRQALADEWSLWNLPPELPTCK